MINVIVNGAQGRMGKVTVEAIQQEPALTLVAALGRGDNLAKCLKDTRPDIVIDFTAPEVVFNNAKTIIEANVCPIIGTSGLTPEQIDELTRECKQKTLGGLIAPNFSIGAVLLQKMAAMAAVYFPDVELIEMHHPMKKDAPSGTAMKTAKIIMAARQKEPSPIATAPSPALGDQRHGNVPIHSIRLPGLVAHEMVIFANPYETLTLRHDTLDRTCFMPGVIMACKKVMMLETMVYGLENLI
jgi:4-hydroxy-tetrahydrodipicolinate reductase